MRARIISKVGMKTSVSISKPDLVVVVAFLQVINDLIALGSPYRIITFVWTTLRNLPDGFCNNINNTYFKRGIRSVSIGFTVLHDLPAIT
jgi:hypothetical protein